MSGGVFSGGFHSQLTAEIMTSGVHRIAVKRLDDVGILIGYDDCRHHFAVVIDDDVPNSVFITEDVDSEVVTVYPDDPSQSFGNPDG